MPNNASGAQTLLNRDSELKPQRGLKGMASSKNCTGDNPVPVQKRSIFSVGNKSAHVCATSPAACFTRKATTSASEGRRLGSVRGAIWSP
jgi:hypothetical protein